MKYLIICNLILYTWNFNLKKMKVLTVVGTRPEIIRLSRVIPVLDQNFDHHRSHTGQNYDYELNQIFSKIWI